VKKGYLLWDLIFISCLVMFGACDFFQDTTPQLIPESIKIDYAWVDPAFSSTSIKLIGLLPFTNAPKYDDRDVIYRNLIDKFISKHPQYKMVSPDEIISRMSSAGLSDDFNVFLGDYLDKGVANRDFLTKIRRVLNVDVVLVGEILALGTYNVRETRQNFLSKRPYVVDIRVNRVGLHLTCFRGKDGRKIWDGKHMLAGRQNLTALADGIAVIFANHFGARNY
jgi:hypothetical protein